MYTLFRGTLKKNENLSGWILILIVLLSIIIAYSINNFSIDNLGCRA